MLNHRRMTVERLTAATPEEEADLRAGFLDGWDSKPPPNFTSDFYDHGRGSAIADKTHDMTREQRRLAWEMIKLKRSATELEWAEECLRRGDLDGWKEAKDAHYAAVMAEITSAARQNAGDGA